ncbi:hypothetical protein VKT23_019582 [Stygiomarasmius scandens]|uniref:Uncharacterized protein n=1 Tax=Marasmiellus scandens TaxID=2682957 RepID=A0ABR1IQI0_9AGAR
MSKIVRSPTAAFLAPRFSQSSGECTTHGNTIECHSSSSDVSPGFIVAMVIIGLIVIGGIVGTVIWCRIRKNKRAKNAFLNPTSNNSTVFPMTAPTQYSLSHPGAQYDPSAYHATTLSPAQMQPYAPTQTVSSTASAPSLGGQNTGYRPSVVSGQKTKDPFGDTTASGIPVIPPPPSTPASLQPGRMG